MKLLPSSMIAWLKGKDQAQEDEQFVRQPDTKSGPHDYGEEKPDPPPSKP